MKWLKALAIFIICFVVFVVIINSDPFDEELHPKVKELLNDTSYPEVDGNAFFALIGLNANEGQDIVQIGHKRVQEFLELEKNSNPFELVEYKPCNEECKKIESHWKSLYKICDRTERYNCLTTTQNDQGFSNPRLELMLSRYEKVIQLQSYTEFNKWNSWHVISFLSSNHNTFFLLSSIFLKNSYQTKSRIEFLKDLRNQNTFLRMMFSQSTLLINKMWARARIEKNLYFISEYLRNNIPSRDEVDLIKEIITPLAKQDLNLETTFLEEYRSAFKINYLYEEEYNLFVYLIFQPNASNNEIYHKITNEVSKWANLSLIDTAKARQNMPKKLQKSKIGIKHIYNPTGKLLNTYSAATFSDYIVKLHDMNNMMKLLDIQLQITLSEDQNIQQILSMDMNLNPYNNQPFSYDEDLGILSFECLVIPKTACRIKIQ